MSKMSGFCINFLFLLDGRFVGKSRVRCGQNTDDAPACPAQALAKQAGMTRVYTDFFEFEAELELRPELETEFEFPPEFELETEFSS